jgi:hypothetical protein
MYTYPHPSELTYSARVLSDEGPLSRSDPHRTERKLAGPGRPGTVDRPMARWSAGRRSACLGRARCLAARGGFTARLKGARWCPGASRRSIPSRGSRGTGKPRTHCAARMRKCGCLKIESENTISFPGRDAACSAASQNRDPNLNAVDVNEPRLCSALRREARRTALRPGHESRGGCPAATNVAWTQQSLNI